MRVRFVIDVILEEELDYLNLSLNDSNLKRFTILKINLEVIYMKYLRNSF